MSLTVQNIVDSVSTDMRKVLSNSGADATLMIDWVDRIHKDCLHTSFYGHLNQANTSVSLVAGTSSYTLSPTDIRRLLFVYDRTTKRPLDIWPTRAQLPTFEAKRITETEKVPEGKLFELGPEPFADVYAQGSETVSTTAGTSSYTLSASARRILAVYDRTTGRALQPLSDADDVKEREVRFLDGPLPQYFKFIAPSTLVLFPTPLVGTGANDSISLEVYYEKTQGPPLFYQLVGSQSLLVMPTPAVAGNLEVVYEKQATTLTALANTLVIPEDGKDMLVAGVNYLVAQYLEKGNAIENWFQLYERLKRGETVI